MQRRRISRFIQMGSIGISDTISVDSPCHPEEMEETADRIRQKTMAYRLLIPASRIILLHFSVSLSMNLPNAGPGR
jgi:hypothetical protein